MLFVSFFKWWFVDGWLEQLKRVERQLAHLSDMFSFGLLVRTLFAPFRQISSGSVRGSLGAQLGALRDRTISRVIGGIIRTFTIIAGGIVMLVSLIWGAVRLVAWAILPLLPLIGLVLALQKVLPWSD